MIDPRTVLIITPSMDGTVVCGFAGGLTQCQGLFGAFRALPGCSEINLARNISAAGFLDSPFEWSWWIDADIEFTRRDAEILMEEKVAGEVERPLAVVAEYSKKDGSGDPSQFGMGFVLLHRSVFEKVKSMTQDDGSPSINYFFWRGAIVDEFFPSFATAAHHWSGEDHSFWKLVHMAGITPRIETRTRLKHWGRAGFPYTGPKEAPVNQFPSEAK